VAGLDGVTYRAAREEDLPAALDLFYESVADMLARHGIDQPVAPRAAVEPGWRHVLSTGIFRVAEAEGRLAAICHAVVRDGLWFLSGFWALPALRGRGAGGPLLRQVWREGERAGARVFFVWSSPDKTAMASYLRLGMLPGHPILTFEGRPAAAPDAPAAYETRTLSLGAAADLDARVRATRREADHRFWLAHPNLTGREVVRGGRAVGYFYVGGGMVGPAAWDDARDAGAVLALGCREAMRAGDDAVVLRVPGVNHDAVRFALSAGLRLTHHSHFLTTAPFGRLERYVTSGPLLY
jgi:GNAT superfamily N-acetyltransferase